MKLNQNMVIVAVVCVVILFVMISDGFNFSSFAIFDGSNNTAGLEVWNSADEQVHTLTNGFNDFEAVINWVNDVPEYYVYQGAWKEYESKFSFVGVDGLKMFSVNSAYSTDYWSKFDGVKIEQINGANNFNKPNFKSSMRSSERSYTAEIKYTNDRLLITVNDQVVIDNHNLKDFTLKQVILSNPKYGYKLTDTWIIGGEWSKCDVTFSIKEISSQDTPYPDYSPTVLGEKTLNEMVWSTSNYQTFFSTTNQIPEWNERLENWSVLINMNGFNCPQYTGDFDIYLHNTQNDFIDLFFNEGISSDTLTIYAPENTKREVQLNGGITNADVLVSNVGGRILIMVDGQEVLDSSDIRGDIGEFSLVDISFSGNYYDWVGSTDFTLSTVAEAEFNKGGFPLWLFAVIVAVIIVLILAWRAK